VGDVPEGTEGCVECIQSYSTTSSCNMPYVSKNSDTGVGERGKYGGGQRAELREFFGARRDSNQRKMRQEDQF
jgi:hypothetical protein